MKNSFNTHQTLTANSKTYHYFSLPELAKKFPEIHTLPYSLKILLENQLRFEDGKTTTTKDVEAFVAWLKTKHSEHEIAYRPARVLMQDFTGVPAVVDLAAMRDAMTQLHGDAKKLTHCARLI